jgi:SnoaL-like domain
MQTLSAAEESGLRRLVDSQAIANALAVHSRGVDRADVNLLSSAYHADATVNYGFFEGPASQLATILSEAQKAGHVTLHRTSNMWIRLEGGDSARSESLIIAYAETPDGNRWTQRLIGGRYLDTHAKRDGSWRLTHRHYVLDWNINRPSTAAWAEPPVDLMMSCPRGGHAAADTGKALLTAGAARFDTKGVPSMSSISHEEIDRALSRMAIHDLLMAYARGVDRGDAALLRSIFHDDAIIVTGVVNGNPDTFSREIVAYVTKNMQRSFHSVANEWVDVRGDRAVGESYAIATVTAGDQDTITGGRYIDEYERRAGVWKILSHHFVMDYSISVPTSYQTDGMYESLRSRGCYGKDDPIYKFWK